MNTITILGSCVTRDVFEMTSSPYKVKNYFARTSLVSIMSDPLSVKESEILLQSNFQRRCVYKDINKCFFEEITRKKSDWIIIDLIDERFNLLQIENSYITKSNVLVASKWAVNRNFTELKRTSDIFPLWEKSAQSFFRKLFTHYKASQVILHKSFWKHQYYDVEGRICDFDNIKQGIDFQNLMLDHYYKYIEKNYPDINIIDMTKEPFLSSENHKWGLSPYHFENAYYECFLRHLKIITASIYQPKSKLYDQIGNTVEKELKLPFVEAEEIDPNFLKKLEDRTQVAIDNNKLVLTIGTDIVSNVQFAYYVQLNKENIHKQWYSEQRCFEFELQQPGHYEILVFCLNTLGEKFSFTKRVDYNL